MKHRLGSWSTLAVFVALSSFPVSAAVALALPHSHAKPNETPTDWIDKGKEVIEAGAILVGGIWTWMLFVKKRQRYPRAAITHTVEFRELSESHSLAHVTVTVKNSGDVLLVLVKHDTRMQVVVPPQEALLKILAQGKDPIGENQTEYPWPTLNSFSSNWQKATREIEPGESQDVDVDFFVPNVVKTVLVYSYFKNLTKHNREIGWDCTTLHDRMSQAPPKDATQPIVPK
ncbi:MAG TPA: hypothetical protein VFO34_05795 [Candidatus Acidoferrales bacterium]|nr:hypothetical protein [Candidatus Acidoferrales bacterium]